MKRLYIILVCIVFTIFFIYFIRSSNNIKLQIENENFKFYSVNKDRECLDDLSNVLKENYNKISNDLNIKLDEKVVIEIYPDISSFHNAIGVSNEANWVVGIGWDNQIKMLSPLNPGEEHTYDTLVQVLVHEFTHILISKINSDLESIPIWLNEGVATYEANQMNDNGISFIKESLENNSVPSLSEMTSEGFVEVGGYIFSYTIIEYIVENYGYDAVRSLIRNPANLENILGNNISDFEDTWNDYLKERVWKY